MLDEPNELFNCEPPSYRENTKIVNEMKRSGSPCSHDQVSIIILQRCPYIRTLLHRIITYCWQKQIFPEEWRYTFTILIYKRAFNKDPANFRPITLQLVFAKVFSSVIRNARLKQRQVIITLLDLKNAFGEMDHNVSMKVLEYHYFPEHIKSLVKAYYTNYRVSIGTDNLTTDPLVIEKAALQSDCLNLSCSTLL